MNDYMTAKKLMEHMCSADDTSTLSIAIKTICTIEQAEILRLFIDMVEFAN